MTRLTALAALLLLLASASASKSRRAGAGVVRCAGPDGGPDAQTLGARVRDADLVFTGKVVGAATGVATRRGGAELRGFQVRVKRVLKGAWAAGRVGPVHVLVPVGDPDDVGDAHPCRTVVRLHHTAIFLARRFEGGDTSLVGAVETVADPLAITLRNLDLVNALVKDLPYQPRPALLEEPCETKHCPFGASCETDASGVAQCRCPEECPPGHGPVCGTDDLTYTTLCVLRRKACLKEDNTRVRHSGTCEIADPCRLVTCPFGGRCVANSPSSDGVVDSSATRCECRSQCSLLVAPRPVCGSDGNDYRDLCHLNREACVTETNITVRFHGKCDPCADLSCADGGVCQVGADRRAACHCADTCSLVVAPVCASDGKTYANDCALRMEACRARTPLRIIYRGKCSTGVNPCTDVKCALGEACVVSEFGVARCECPAPCEPIIRPVCADDSRTYESACELRRAACAAKLLVAVKHAGPCGEGGPCFAHSCDWGAICVAVAGTASCECPHCPAEFAPVCGTDGATYDNECHLRQERCRSQREVHKRHDGKCNDCDKRKCDHYAVCDSDGTGNSECVCPGPCAKSDAPVCGTDGKTYPNECELRQSSCRSRQYVIAAHAGDCDLCAGVKCTQGARCESGECVCPTDCADDTAIEPLCASNMITYRNECELRKAKCQHRGVAPLTLLFYGECRENLLLEGAGNCSTSLFGCCADGKTHAQGAGGAGCASACVCHRLGTVPGSPCPADAEQCDCKPGVGGWRCDRCHPGFWGLTRIAEGRDGCSPCECSEWGSVRDDCEQMTGRCVCKPGVQGPKCTLCPEPGARLRPQGCVSGNSTASCATKTCLFGGVCELRNGRAACACHAACADDARATQPVCGSDGHTYPSECRMKREGCRRQTEVVVAALGPCKEDALLRRSTAQDDVSASLYKSTRHLLLPASKYYGYSSQSQLAKSSVYHGALAGYRAVETVRVVHALLGDLCTEDADCGVANSRCVAQACFCLEDHVESPDRQHCTARTEQTAQSGACASHPCQHGGSCIDGLLGEFACTCVEQFEGPRCEQRVPRGEFAVPAFDGQAFVRLRHLKAYHKLNVELEFQTFANDGILLYSQQKDDGTGDFVSIALVNGFVEFRYNLGAGAVLIKSAERVTLKKFHRVVAKRYHRDGLLKLDDLEDVVGQSQGSLKALDLSEHAYIGYVPTNVTRVFSNAGTTSGLVGCVRRLRVGPHQVQLRAGADGLVELAHGLRECGQNPCAALPCLNGATCHAQHGGQYRCVCAQGHTGPRCEARADPCATNTCAAGSTCAALPQGGFACRCPPGRQGLLCQDLDGALRELRMPDFTGADHLALPRLEGVGRGFALELWFMARAPDGVLLYNGQTADAKGDFVAVNLVAGRVHFSFDLGSGPANLTTKEEVSLGQWHVARASRVNKDGTLQLDNGPLVTGSSGPPLNELNVELPLYIGGVPSLAETRREAGLSVGLDGVVQRVVLNAQPLTSLHRAAVWPAGLHRYAAHPACQSKPCLHGGVCQPHLEAFTCTCPLQHTGTFCETQLQLEDISLPVRFTGDTFFQYPSKGGKNRKGERSNRLELTFRTSQSDGLLLWTNKGHTLKNDYLSIAVVNDFVEFSFNLGKQATLLSARSKVFVSDGSWHTVVVHRRRRAGYVSVDGETPVRVLAARGATLLNTSARLFIGGAPTLPSGLPAAYYLGFRGCVQRVRVDRKPLNLLHRRGDDRSPVLFCHDNDV